MWSNDNAHFGFQVTGLPHCRISLALDVFGDNWTLLVVRDLMFKGERPFGEFADSEEKIATNVLADRQSKLEAEGLITREVDPDNARQRVYALTLRGLELAPILVELILWSASHDPDSAPDAAFVRQAKQNRSGLLRSIARTAHAFSRSRRSGS